MNHSSPCWFRMLWIVCRESDELLHEMTEEDIEEARQQRYGRRRSMSIDYGSKAGGNREYEQV